MSIPIESIANPGHTHCEWRENSDGQWDTQCGHCFEFNTPEDMDENSDIEFCMYCGKPMDVYEFIPAVSEGER